VLEFEIFVSVTFYYFFAPHALVVATKTANCVRDLANIRDLLKNIEWETRDEIEMK